MKKRILSIFVALSLCLGLLPGTALAAGDSVVIHANSSFSLENGARYIADDTNGVTKTEDESPNTPHLYYNNGILTVCGDMKINKMMTITGDLTITGDENASLTMSDQGRCRLNDSTLTLDGSVDFHIEYITNSSSSSSLLTTTEAYSGAVVIDGQSAGSPASYGVCLDLKSSESITIDGMISYSRPSSSSDSITLKSSGDITLNCCDFPNLTITGKNVSMSSSGAPVYMGNSLTITAEENVTIENSNTPAVLGPVVVSAGGNVTISCGSVPVQPYNNAGSLTVKGAQRVSVTGKTATASENNDDDYLENLFPIPVTFEDCGEVNITDNGTGKLLKDGTLITSDCVCFVEQLAGENRGSYVIMPGDSTLWRKKEDLGSWFLSGIDSPCCWEAGEGWILYTTADGVDVLTLYNATYEDIIRFSPLPTSMRIVAKGDDNHIGIITGSFPKEIDESQGTLNAIVSGPPTQTGSGLSYTVYGRANLPISLPLGNMSLTIRQGAELTVPEDITLTVSDLTCLINNGSLINNGNVVLMGTAAENASTETVRNLNLTGNGMVEVRTTDETGNPVSQYYTNGGERQMAPVGTLDLSSAPDDATHWDGQGYKWNATKKTLTLAEGFNATNIILPDDTVTIETLGAATIGTLAISGGSPGQTELTFSGAGTLTIQERLELSGGDGNSLTVAQGAHIIAEKGIAGGASGVNFPITVKGTLTARGYDDNSFPVQAIYAGKVSVGDNGVLEVSGKAGVYLNGMNAGGDGFDFTGVFTVTEEGRFTANCEIYNVMAASASGQLPAGTTAKDAFPLGADYLPDDCKAEITNSNSEINFIRISTNGVFNGPMTIHKTHTWGSDWKSNGTQHWRECTFQGCGERNEVGNHVYDNDQDAICNTCGYTRTIAPPHSHVWAGAWSSDSNHHWHECTVAGCSLTDNSQKGSYGPHVYDDEQDTTCNTCGYVRTVAPPHTHLWAEAWSSDSNYHWHECTVVGCGLVDNSRKGGYGTHVYDDDRDTACNTCGHVRTVTIPPDSASPSDSSDSRKSKSIRSYQVIVEQADHGEAVSNRDRAAAGSTVTLAVTPERGYALDTLTVTDAQGNALRLTEQDGGKYTFTMPASTVTASAVFAPLPGDADCPSRAFSDLDTGEWYHEAADYILRERLMDGYSGGRFGPNDPVSRAQLAQILWNHAGKPAAARSAFPDIPASEWYTGAVDWASETGIVSGYSDGRFGPDDSVTREQLAVMLWRYSGSPSAAGQTLPFPDAGRVSGFALAAMRWAVKQGILSGRSDGRLDPGGYATRAQTAQMLKNAIGNPGSGK